MCRFIVFLAVAFCHFHQSYSQMSYCTANMKYGGQCVDIKDTCPVDTVHYQPYSNYLGCETTTRKCCANTKGIVKNPDGIDPNGPKTCGLGSLLPSSRILDGDISEPCDWPFLVSIRALKTTSASLTYDGTTHACQGALIDTKWVLTSPVCLISAGFSFTEAKFRILIVAGEYNVSAVDLDPATRTPQEQIIKADQIFFHPDYKFKTQDEIFPFNDLKSINSNGVALIKLAEPIIGRCSGIVCLPTQSEASNTCARYNECVMTGWGFATEAFSPGPSTVLLVGQVRVISGVACEYLTQKLNLTNSRPAGTMCQTPVSRNTDGCFGDEGGAILCSNGYQWVIRGIITFNMCLKNRYNFFSTDVALFLPWIQSTMTNNA